MAERYVPIAATMPPRTGSDLAKLFERTREGMRVPEFRSRMAKLIARVKKATPDDKRRRRR